MLSILTTILLINGFIAWLGLRRDARQPGGHHANLAEMLERCSFEAAFPMLHLNRRILGYFRGRCDVPLASLIIVEQFSVVSVRKSEAIFPVLSPANRGGTHTSTSLKLVTLQQKLVGSIVDDLLELKVGFQL